MKPIYMVINNNIGSMNSIWNGRRTFFCNAFWIHGAFFRFGMDGLDLPLVP